MCLENASEYQGTCCDGSPCLSLLVGDCYVSSGGFNGYIHLKVAYKEEYEI
jgi:hypothetical protein